MMDLSLVFDSEKAREPIISNIVLKTGILINILNVKINDEGGIALISVPDDDIQVLINLLEKQGIKVTYKKTIQIDNELCIECGACVSLCGVKALTYGEDFSVKFNENKCIYCFLCVDSCPRFAIKSKESDQIS
ncbi:MAG: 4Fe-4S dicluster domain-containing protein [Candidatus Lokiarchaeota archaeon]|nr:4Fe-4S dicluster domain-containing protein [Candidatus Lokiarchaeota archaeon]